MAEFSRAVIKLVFAKTNRTKWTVRPLPTQLTNEPIQRGLESPQAQLLHQTHCRNMEELKVEELKFPIGVAYQKSRIHTVEGTSLPRLLWSALLHYLLSGGPCKCQYLRGQPRRVDQHQAL